MKNPGRKKKNIPEKSLLELAIYSVKTNEHQFRSPVVSPQDYFDDIQRRSWETSDAWSNQLKLPVWAYNKPPFLKLIKNLYVSLQSQFTCFCKSNINQTLATAVVWYEEWGLQVSQKSDIW